MSNKRYLQRLGQSWYLRVKVPPSLQSTVGNTHIRRALHTRDLDEANRRKWPALAQVRAFLNEVSRCPAPLAELRLAPPWPPHHSAAAITTFGNLRAHGGLDDLAEKWAMTSASKTVQYQRRQTYGELRAYLGCNAVPEQVSGATAASYVDSKLLLSKDSPSTRRRKLSALAAFWAWMASRHYVGQGDNPWRGFRLRVGEGADTILRKRDYTTSELVTLFSGGPTYPGLREVMVLGLFTGARIEEICSLRNDDVRIERRVAYLTIAKSKTAAGRRTIAVAHPIPLRIVRMRSKEGAGQFFPELKGGGYDEKLSWRVGQAFRYHRNGRGLTGATDFHSLRRTFITRLENLGVDQVHIARYVGHSLPTLAFKLYSGGATDATQLATARAIHYPRAVEAAVASFLEARTREGQRT